MYTLMYKVFTNAVMYSVQGYIQCTWLRVLQKIIYNVHSYVPMYYAMYDVKCTLLCTVFNAIYNTHDFNVQSKYLTRLVIYSV